MIGYGDVAVAAVGVLGTYYAGGMVLDQYRELTGQQAGIIKTHFAEGVVGSGASFFGVSVPGLGYEMGPAPRLPEGVPLIGGMGANAAAMGVLTAGGLAGAGAGMASFVRIKPGAPVGPAAPFMGPGGAPSLKARAGYAGARVGRWAFNAARSKGTMIGFGATAGLAAGMALTARFVDRLSQNVLAAGPVGPSGSRGSLSQPIRTSRRASATPSRLQRQAAVDGGLVLDLHKTRGAGAVRR